MKKDQGKLTVGSSVVGSSDGFIVVGSTVVPLLVSLMAVGTTFQQKFRGIN